MTRTILTLTLAAAACALPGCSVIGVETRPPVVEPDTRFICTETYWLPAADVVATTAVIGYAAWYLERNRQGCADGDPDRCHGQAGLVVLLPLATIASSVYGIHAVSSCRAATAWQRATPRPPRAGQLGAACAPVFGREGRCEAGHCARGLCQPEVPPAQVRRTCAVPIARWRAERDPTLRARLLADLSPACRALVR